MTQRFVRVPNDWFQENNDRTFVSKLGYNAFTMWFLLNKISAEMNMSDTIQLQIKQTVLDMKGIKGFAKSENIRKILLTLKRHKLIECNQLTSKTKPSDLINIKILEQDYSNGFSCISCKLYDDKILKIQPSGLLVYCLLYKNHNTNLGCQLIKFGHAEMTRESISRFTGISSVKTISHIIDSLKNAKSLIKVQQKKIISQHTDDKTETKYLPNCYQVLAKFDSKNKYYIDQKQPQQ